MTIDLTVDGKQVQTAVARPAGDGPHPGVVVAIDGLGMRDYIHEVVGALADAGYAAISPDLFHGGELDFNTLRDESVLKDMNTAIEHLQSQPFVRQHGFGVTGFCMGGRITYLMAAARADVIRAAAVWYGGNIFVSKAAGEMPSPFEQTADISAPVLGLFGVEDSNPSPDDVKKIDAELTRLGKVHEFHSFPDAGHGFHTSDRPDMLRPNVAEDAWEKCIAWFDKYVRDAS
jgi:carboxymethylenebutenolidase